MAIDPDCAAEDIELDVTDQGLDKLLSGRGLKSDHVDDDVWSELYDAFPEIALFLLGLAVNNHILDLGPGGVWQVRFRAAARDIDDVISSSDKVGNEVASNMATATDNDNTSSFDWHVDV